LFLYGGVIVRQLQAFEPLIRCLQVASKPKLAGLNRCAFSVGGFLAESETVTQLPRRIAPQSVSFSIDQHIHILRFIRQRFNTTQISTTIHHLLKDRSKYRIIDRPRKPET